MNKQLWTTYLETPMRNTKPVKIDLILKKRMETFIRAKMQSLEDVLDVD